MAQKIKNLPAMQEAQVQSLGWEDPLEKGMMTHSSNLAWRIPGQQPARLLCPWDCKESGMTEQLLLRRNDEEVFKVSDAGLTK